MQKYIDKGSELQIRSVVALDHLKNYIYVEADKEAHVREVCTIDIFQVGVDFLKQALDCALSFVDPWYIMFNVPTSVILLLQACKGLRNINTQKIKLVPIREMTDVLSVESKVIDLGRDTWVRMKTGTYKGDLAKVWTNLLVTQDIILHISLAHL